MEFDIKAIHTNKEFDNHILTTVIHDDRTGLHGYIAIHSGGIKNPAFGATRFWKYETDQHALQDVLRLSRMMTYKSALIGSKYGGAKSVLCIPGTSYNRMKLFLKYAETINYFSGHFQTGADVGVSEKDIKMMKGICPFIVGVKYDPVKYTIDGIYISIGACLQELFKTSDFSNRTFAIQGLGKTGIGLLQKLYDNAKHIYVSDLNSSRMNDVKHKYPKVTCVAPNEILFQKVDVLSPCALGNILNTKSVKKINSKIICGSANCQLDDQKTGELLWRSGILYAPDYVVNAGGLISVIDEYDNPKVSSKRVMGKVMLIGNTLTKIIQLSKRKQTPTNYIADDLAEKISRKFV